MARLGVVAAARTVGKSRATIRRYISAGKLSCQIAADGTRRIDTAELVRVFGELHPAGTRQEGTGAGTLHPAAPSPDTTELVAELRHQISRLERDLDAERDERRRLVGILERAQLTDQRTARQQPDSTAAPRRPRRTPTPPAAPTLTPTIGQQIADTVASWLRPQK